MAEVMSGQVATCRPENTLEFAEKLMCERQVHRIPVVDEDGHPVGMASLSDIALESQQAASAKQRVAVTRTLANVCQPRGALTNAKKPRASATR